MQAYSHLDRVDMTVCWGPKNAYYIKAKVQASDKYKFLVQNGYIKSMQSKHLESCWFYNQSCILKRLHVNTCAAKESSIQQLESNYEVDNQQKTIDSKELQNMLFMALGVTELPTSSINREEQQYAVAILDVQLQIAALSISVGQQFDIRTPNIHVKTRFKDSRKDLWEIVERVGSSYFGPGNSLKVSPQSQLFSPQEIEKQIFPLMIKYIDHVKLCLMPIISCCIMIIIQREQVNISDASLVVQFLEKCGKVISKGSEEEQYGCMDSLLFMLHSYCTGKNDSYIHNWRIACSQPLLSYKKLWPTHIFQSEENNSQINYIYISALIDALGDFSLAIRQENCIVQFFAAHPDYCAMDIFRAISETLGFGSVQILPSRNGVQFDSSLIEEVFSLAKMQLSRAELVPNPYHRTYSAYLHMVQEYFATDSVDIRQVEELLKEYKNTKYTN